MKPQHPIFLMIIAAIFLSSCVTLDSGTRTIGATEKPETFYVGRADTKLYAEPRFSENYIATLPLHEKVLRDQLTKGFAHVTIPKTGQSGWVNNAHLVWRKPSASPPPAKPTPQKAAPSHKPPEENAIQAPSHPNPEVEGRDASIFNAF